MYFQLNAPQSCKSIEFNGFYNDTSLVCKLEMDCAYIVPSLNTTIIGQ